MANPIPSGTEFLVNTTTANGQSQPTITALADGRFVISWTDNSATGGDTSVYAVRAQMFNADGSKSGGEFLVNTTTASFQYEPTIRGLADGRFVISWRDASASGGDTSNSAVRAQVFNADGSKSGAEFLVNTTTNGDQIQPTIAALADGRFVISWTDTSISGGDSSSYAVRAQIFNADGSKVGAEFLVNTTFINSQYDPNVMSLADGRFVISWRDNSTSGGDTSSSAVRAQVFNADGSKSGAEFLVNTTTANNQYQPTITALADGRFVISWTDTSNSGGDTSGLAVRAQVFNADGSKSGAEFLVNTTTADDQFEPTITGLADGRFVISWTDTSNSGGDTSLYAIRAQVFNADGSKSGAEFLVNTTTASYQNEPTITALADGRFVISWTDFSATGGDTSDAAIRGQIFDPREAAVNLLGSALAEHFVGTQWGDALRGYLGNDRLDGAGGDDRVWGEDGNDRVNGNLGDDTLSGGTGNDTAIGDAGRDSLSGDAGNDSLSGGLGNDRLSGGSGKDRISGGAGADLLTGGKGADVFVFANAGEAINDRMTDFAKGDKIDLSAFMDGGKFIGAAAFKPAGTQAEVRYVKATGTLQGDVDGNGTVDWSLTIANKAALVAGDFLF